MKKLVHVVHGLPDRGTAVNILNTEGTDILRARSQIEVIMPHQLSTERSNMQKEAEFWLVDERDIAGVLPALAHHNPGCEVRVYSLEQVAQCPAAEMVVKTVSQHGVLPS